MPPPLNIFLSHRIQCIVCKNQDYDEVNRATLLVKDLNFHFTEVNVDFQKSLLNI